MNRSTFTLIVSVLLFLIVISIGYISSFQYNVEGVGAPTPTAVVVSPTPEVTQIIGTIDEVNGKVEYKNATLLRVNGQPVYLTAETSIVDQNDNEVDKEKLAVRQPVVVEGSPAEGGIEAVRITVVAVTTPTRTPTVTPTPTAGTATPTAAPAI